VCASQPGPGLQADPELSRLVGEAPEAYAAAGDAVRAADATPRAPPPPSRDLLSASPYEEELSEAEELVRASQPRQLLYLWQARTLLWRQALSEPGVADKRMDGTVITSPFSKAAHRLLCSSAQHYSGLQRQCIGAQMARGRMCHDRPSPVGAGRLSSPGRLTQARTAHQAPPGAAARAQRLKLELVKRERSGLMDALAALREDEGRGGSAMQAADLRRLRHELELKQERLNELHAARPASARPMVPRLSSLQPD